MNQVSVVMPLGYVCGVWQSQLIPFVLFISYFEGLDLLFIYLILYWSKADFEEEVICLNR